MRLYNIASRGRNTEPLGNHRTLKRIFSNMCKKSLSCFPQKACSWIHFYHSHLVSHPHASLPLHRSKIGNDLSQVVITNTVMRPGPDQNVYHSTRRVFFFFFAFYKADTEQWQNAQSSETTIHALFGLSATLTR